MAQNFWSLKIWTALPAFTFNNHQIARRYRSNMYGRYFVQSHLFVRADPNKHKGVSIYLPSLYASLASIPTKSAPII
jgi:hypothetical protein